MSSIDLSELDMNATLQEEQRNNETAQARRVSWDDFTLFHQTVSDWNQPTINNHYRSQNPSPKHGCAFVEGEHHDISPLSMGMTHHRIGIEPDSETEDMDTTSASSGTGSPRELIAHKQASRNSVEDTMDTSDDYAEPQNTFKELSPPHLMACAAVAAASGVGAGAGDGDGDDGDDEQEESDDNAARVQSRKDVRLIVMELQLNDMNDKCQNLMRIIRQLKEKNEYLEQSKLKLVSSTAAAMDGLRSDVKMLSKQNEILLAHRSTQ